MRDLYHNLEVAHIAAPAVKTASLTSSAIDMQGFNSLVVLVSVGATGDTLSGSIYWTVSIQESDDDSSYTDVVAADLHGGVNAVVIDSNSEDEVLISYGYKGKKRYVKALATKTGTHTNGTPIGMVAVKGNAANNPV